MQPAKFLLSTVTFLLLIFVFCVYTIPNLAYSQTQPSLPKLTTVPGPIMFCGDTKELDKILVDFKELKFMVLSNMQQGETGVHYIFYRNANTGTWSLIAYNMDNAPLNIACLVGGGFEAFILPDTKELNKMLKKQEEGFDKVKEPDTES